MYSCMISFALIFSMGKGKMFLVLICVVKLFMFMKILLAHVTAYLIFALSSE